MKTPEHILVPVDESEASQKAVSYVGRMLSGKENCRVHLFHVVEPIGPFWASAQGDLTTEAKGPPDDPQRKLIETAKQVSRPVIERMTETLTGAGMATDCIDSSWFVASREDALAPRIVDEARSHGYGTVVLGRSALPWYRELFHQHIGDRVLKKGEGLSVWVIE